MTPSIVPSARSWILRFKHHRTTILLHVDPLQKLSSIRAELLKAVQQAYPDGTLNGHVIPDNSSELLLARPVDINDLTLGWEPLERDDGLEEALAEDQKGKGKATLSSKSGRASKEKTTDCPQGAGLRDGGVVAFRFRSEQDAESKARDDEGIDVGEDDEKLDGETLVGEAVAEKWDVVVPSMEEIYGEEGGVEAEGEGAGDVEGETEGLERLSKGRAAGMGKAARSDEAVYGGSMT